MGSQMLGNDWATEQTTNNLGGLNNRNLFSHTSGGWKSEIAVLAWMTLFLICRQPPSCCVLMWPLLRAYSWKEKVSKPFGVFSQKGCNPHCKDYTLKVSPNNYLPKAPFQMSSLGIVVQLLSCVWLPWTHGLQHARLPFSSTSPRTCSNSCTLSWWCHPTISSSVIPFSSYLQSFPASGSFLMSLLFTSRGQGIGASASASVLPMNIQGWFPLGLTVWISLQSKTLSRVFSNTTVQKHQFFAAQLSL